MGGSNELRADRIAEAVGGRVEGDPAAVVTGISGLRGARPGDLSFATDARYAALAADSQASVLLVPDGLDLPDGAPAAVIRVPDVDAALDRLTERFTPPEPPRTPGVHPTAVVADDARLGDDVAVGPCSVVESGARIGDGATLGAQVFVGHDAEVGEHSRLRPGVRIEARCRIGRCVTLHPGVVIGADGFGYTFRDGAHAKVPQIGTVIVEDDVEIGANSTVDRARFGATRIGQGTKIDNLVMIAHNVQVGRHCVITGQCGLAGSSSLGDYVMMGAQSGVADHVGVGDRVRIGAQSGLGRHVPPGTGVMGTPAEPQRLARRMIAGAKRLPDLIREVRELRSQVDELARAFEDLRGTRS
jgi:UDP-3-O-[3-hydroxymyristoyl] glucosamine N-acyltransferase